MSHRPTFNIDISPVAVAISIIALMKTITYTMKNIIVLVTKLMLIDLAEE